MASAQKADSEFVLITGATDGIGLILAREFARLGFHVLATGRRGADEGAKLFADCPSVHYLQADQAAPEEAARRILEAIGKNGFSSCRFAVLNAGTGYVGDCVSETPERTDEQLSVNLTAPILIARAVSPFLFARRGTLALIGSIAHKGSSRIATYAATKGALDAFARSLREEWRGRARVKMLHPGPTGTDMHRKAGLDIGMAGFFFASPRRMAAAIMTALVRGPDRQNLTLLTVSLLPRFLLPLRVPLRAPRAPREGLNP